ncbi:uncharacterized protein DSM5745_11072 [Aspergillus mulundensis]|uniref:Major facilitator superfamily (MFS) profile domain-containing protein n=1 Tax=Aspergillus mulundensis TaxID=1810919 RepID=A0A3D8QCE0_9EURO|nr:hypothetical protein DSM5745_11072 [Aspergillus mulundensis]RDW59377.1 hypothetical protein DSM5745_11072 [Aspergillus mulundensis]
MQDAPASNDLVPAPSSNKQNYLLQMPTELIQHVAYFLPENTDRVNFALCSKGLKDKILPAESHIWRRLFRDTYDDLPHRTLVDYKIEYQIRALVLPRTVEFGHGQKERQTYWLELVGNMVREGLWQKESKGWSKNFDHFRQVLAGTEFLNRPVSGHLMEKPDLPSDLFCAVRLAFTYLALDPFMSVKCLRTDYDARIVYACPDTESGLVSDKFHLSTETALHIRNFWVRHLLNPEESIFYNSYLSLPDCHRPGNPDLLGTIYHEKRKLHLSWFGYESCFCPYPPTSSDLEVRHSCADGSGHIIEVEHITLQLDIHDDPKNWPDLFEKFVTEYTHDTTFFRGIQTYHGSSESRSIAIRGFIEGIYGAGLRECWSRICWVAYKQTKVSDGEQEQGQDLGSSFFNGLWPPIDMDTDFDYIYGYEAVLVPGSSLMVGHWWDPRADEATGAKGPFIFWRLIADDSNKDRGPAMTSRDEADPSAAHAPLLAPEFPARQHNEVDQPRHSSSRFIWYLTFSAGISGLLFGYDTGVISSTLVSIGSDLSNRALTTLDKSLITSCTSLFALIASPLAGILADRLGRKKVILVADILFTVGAFIQAASSEVWSMIIGRSIVGLAVGSASLVTPLYISELAPSDARGRLVTILSLFITGGQVVAYIVGWLFSYVDGGWRWIVGLGMLPAIFQLIIVIALPETPRWLVQAGHEDKARGILSKVYQDDQIAKQTLRDIQQEVAEEEAVTKTSEGAGVKQRAHDLFQIGGNRRALTIAVMLQALQQLCGFNSLMYFSATIFSLLSFSSPTLTSLSVAMTNFIFTLLAFVYIDRIGRRRILLCSIPVMAISLFVCALTFSSVELPNNSPEAHARQAAPHSSILPLVILLCLTIYTAAYAFGLGNVPWQQSELFPLNVRSLGSALATATNWGSNFIIGLTFLPMMELLSPSLVFTLYSVVSIIGWFGVRAIYPEMNGLKLEDVKDLLADGWGVRESLVRARNRSA